MKSQKHYLVAMALMITALTLTPSVFAQTVRLRAQIPFDFYMNDTPMPAGTYLVSTLSDGQIVRFESAKGATSAFVMTAATQKHLPNLSRVVFNRYGDRNFLAQVYWAGQSSGREIQATSLEQEARNGRAPVKVAIVPK